MPLRKLPGWLMSISPGKVKDPAVRERVIQYQNECDDVLWDYWSRGEAINPRLKTKTALPGGLSLEQQDAIKGMIAARVEPLPKAKQGKAAMRCWSSLKSKFGCGYKEIPAEQFTEAVSLLARIVLEGELLPAQDEQQVAADIPPSLAHRRWLVYFDHEGKEHARPISENAFIGSTSDFLRALTDANGQLVTVEDLFRFVLAATQQLQRRSTYRDEQLKKMRAMQFA